MTRRTVEGQAVELEWVRSNTWRLDDADYLAMVELKTSWYSFITPLQVGAIAAGAAPDQLPPLEPLGRHLGLAFQITDDLLNLRADPEDYGKEIGGDLWEGKRTLILLHALRHAPPSDLDRALRILARRRPTMDTRLMLREVLDRLAARGELSAAGREEILEHVDARGADEAKNLDDVRWLYELLHRAGSLDHARAVAARQADEAAAVLASLDWFPASNHRDVLRGLVDFVHERTR
jgi:geranylgeranyl diphosphate synthase type II